jgi:replicative DNA helicase
LTHAAGTITAKDIANQVTRWADEGWVPEVIVIDYADILGAPIGLREKIEQIDHTWRELRAMSTQMRCLVLTASQSNKEGQTAWLLNKGNFSDSKTKVAHVTAMIGLNMTESERRQNICRYNYVALREAEFMQDKPAYVAVAGCTRVGRPSLISCWPND